MDVIEATNADVESFTKSGSQQFDDTLGGFFASVTGDTTYITDPQVAYDPYINRFWVTAAASNDSKSESKLLIALSNSSGAISDSSFSFVALDATQTANAPSTLGCDRDNFGFDAQAIYLTCNMFTFPLGTGAFTYATIRVMTTGQFISNTCCYWSDFLNIRDSNELTNPFSMTIQPARMHGAQASNGEFLVDAHQEGGTSNQFEVFQITSPQTCCIPGHQTAPLFNQAERSVNGFSPAPSVIQPTPNTNLDPGDTKLLFAIWQNGMLSTGHDVGCIAGSVACIGYTEIDVSSFPTMSVVNDWTTDTGFHRYYPSVDVNSSGYKTMVFTRSFPDGHNPPSAAVLSIPPSSVCTNCTDSETVTQAGATDYKNLYNGVNRWGDYSGASVDPDGQGVWVAGEFAASDGSTPTNKWGTQLTLTYESNSHQVWVQQMSATVPQKRTGAAMAYMPGSGQIVMFGGYQPDVNVLLNDTWTWNGSNWTLLHPASSPSPRWNAGMVYDPAGGYALLFGGHGSSIFSDTWKWDGTNWTQLTPKTTPPARQLPAIAYLSSNSSIVMFGGNNINQALSDTWTWNGTTWTQLRPKTAPGARYGAAMTYDQAHSVAVMFGGYNYGMELADTWTWNGTAWSKQNPATSPAKRDGAGFGYDSFLGSPILFGGADEDYGTALVYNDTWLWNGTNWIQQQPGTYPAPRFYFPMVYDASTRTLILFGGWPSGSSVPGTDTWTY